MHNCSNIIFFKTKLHTIKLESFSKDIVSFFNDLHFSKVVKLSNLQMSCHAVVEKCISVTNVETPSGPGALSECIREQIIQGLIIVLKERDLQQILQWSEIEARLHFFL